MGKLKRDFFDSKGDFIDDGEPIFLSGKVIGGTPRFSATREDYFASCRDKESPISQMIKDPVMYSQIKKGNGSDRLLKRDAEYLQSTYQNRKKKEAKKERFKRVEKAREKYKQRYKTNPI